MVLEIITLSRKNWESRKGRMKQMGVGKDHMTMDQKEFLIRKIPD